ncbi:MAG: 5'/3'-nucleotidase SurE [bacterium]|nr:5'/3'-nucleotidase SurE [bacterium]
MKTLLLTNDDGYLSEGIKQLKRCLSGSYDVYMVAPDRERSAISMSLTINQPVRMIRLGERDYIVDGTPADCINLALTRILPQPPDLLVSGMNEGENICEDVFFSGTVAGAFIGQLYRIPSMAVSLVTDPAGGGYRYEEGARITGDLIQRLLPIWDPTVVYNVNIPPGTSGKVEITTTGSKQYQPTIVERSDPRNKTYYWLGTGNPTMNGGKGTDLEAVNNGNISLTVLKYDLNCPVETHQLSEALNGNGSKD